MLDDIQLSEALSGLSAHDPLSDAPVSDWSMMNRGEHFAQFYEKDSFLLRSLAGFVATGLTAGESVIVVATESHRRELEDLLLEAGIDLVGASRQFQYIALDAGATLEKFLIDGEPDRVLFNQVIGSAIAEASKGRPALRVFGEMVAILWERGNCDAAIRTEELWNELSKKYSFQLFCAYPISGFSGAAFSTPLLNVCREHSRIIPAESYTTLPTTENRLRAILELQQKARVLEIEINERKQAEDALREAKQTLEVQVEDLRRLHEMSVDLVSTLDVESLLREVLRSAMAVHGTDLGLLSLCDFGQEGLRVKVQSGFDEAFLKEVDFVPSRSGACGLCFEQRRRIVVEDVDADPWFAPYRETAQRAGFRACHSTPLITRHGTIIGVLSVHFREPHRPAEREIRLMDLYARTAADSIDAARLHRQLQQQLEMRDQLLSREQMARAEAENANRMKDQFLATVSHELRTPLNAIIGWTHMLRTARLDPRTAERALETIDRNALAQAQLVEDILDVSRVITGKLRLNLAPVDIAAVINAAIDSVQLAAESKGIQLAITLDPSVRHILGDAGRLQQVVWNLLSNAIKFTPARGLVEVKLLRAGENVEIQVSDSGQGINPEFLPFIFDRFRQADGSTTRQHGGLGLGLSIVRHLMELHGGTVHADSAGEDLGATFTLSLPLPDRSKPSNNTKRARSTNLYGTETINELAAPLPSLEQVRVLVVDDDPDTLQILTVMLQGQSANVETAGSVSDAFEILQWYNPDVVVSDLAMPEEDGYSFIQKIRNMVTDQSAIPAIALTAHVRIEDRTRALSAGFNQFVPKPVEPNELITAISNLAEPSK